MGRQRLKERCEELGFTPAKLARELDVSTKTIARLYRGESRLRIGKHPKLAQLIAWSPARLRAELNGDPPPAPELERGWWSKYSTLEQSALWIRAYQPLLVPGLLQTRAYATALLGDDELVEKRLNRQHLITRQNPIEFRAVIDESVLYRPIGGAAVLAGQLARLATVAERPNVQVLVLPFSSPEQPAYWGALTVAWFDWPGGLVYLEHKGGYRDLDTYEEVEEHMAVFDRIEELALPSADSLALIRQRVKDLSV